MFGEVDGVIDFIAATSGQVKVTYNGASKSLTRPLASADKEAVRHCYKLAKQYETVRTLREDCKTQDLKVRFFEKKISMQ